jgi:hypothetical protein
MKAPRIGKPAPPHVPPAKMLFDVDPNHAAAPPNEPRMVDLYADESMNRGHMNQINLENAAQGRAMDDAAAHPVSSVIRDGVRSLATGGQHMELDPIERNAANSNYDRNRGVIAAVLAGKAPTITHADAEIAKAAERSGDGCSVGK